MEVGDEIVTVTHDYPDFSIMMAAFLCKPLADSFRLKEHVAFEWRGREELAELDWAAADVDIVKAILA